MVGGIFSACLLVGSMLGFTFNAFKMQFSLANQLFLHRYG
jgi:hypothetical protein